MLIPSGVILVFGVCPSLCSSLLFHKITFFLTCFSLPPHGMFSQELVSVGTEGRTGDLSVLGNVKHKMVCSPDFEALLESSA